MGAATCAMAEKVLDSTRGAISVDSGRAKRRPEEARNSSCTGPRRAADCFIRIDQGSSPRSRCERKEVRDASHSFGSELSVGLAQARQRGGLGSAPTFQPSAAVRGVVDEEGTFSNRPAVASVRDHTPRPWICLAFLCTERSVRPNGMRSGLPFRRRPSPGNHSRHIEWNEDCGDYQEHVRQWRRSAWMPERERRRPGTSEGSRLTWPSMTLQLQACHFLSRHR